MKPTSSLVMPMLPNTSATTGISISTSLRRVLPPDVVVLGEGHHPDRAAAGDEPGELAHRYSLYVS